MIQRYTVALTLLVLTLMLKPALAQDVVTIQAQFPKDNVVMLSKIDHYEINIVADTIQVIKHVEERILYLTANDLRYSQDYIYYNSFSKITNIEAYTSVPNKITEQHL